MKDNKEFIKEIYEKYDEYLKDEKNQKVNKKQNFMNSNLVKGLSVAAVFAIVISGVWVSNNLLNKNTSNITLVGKTETKDKLSLNKVNDFETFYKIVSDNYKSNYKDSYNENDILKSEESIDDAVESSSISGDMATNKQSVTTDDYSKTNIQVENVDEADIVKTNGKYIFYVISNKIIIVDIQDKIKMKKIAEISFENENFTPSELYINNDKLIILGNERSYTYTNNIVKETTNNIYKKGIYKQKAIAIIYNINIIEKPEEVRRVEIEGNYVSSRLIDNNIYFVSSKSIAAYDIIRTDIDNLDEDMCKPSYKDTIDSTREQLIDFDQIYYFEDIENLNYLTLAGFSIDGKEEANIKTFLGAGEDIYCSTENMYIVKSKNVYDADTRMSFGQDTKILKFSIDNGKIEFKAEANVEGGINNQFSMDENNGYFRIATTIGKTYNMDNSTSNSLYILDENLKEVGRLDGIAKGEKIYSVRYAGDRAYVVTFKEIDPLFVIDISNEKNPKILGELKIPGYSTYLHPYDETHLIGFGYDTKTNSSGTGIQNNGLKMSMFDITDFNNPKEMFSIKIGESGTSSPLTNNHKALLFSKEKNLIAFPVTSYSKGKTEYKAQVYDINLDKGFTLKGEIEHKDENNSNKKYYYANYKLSIDRIIYSNNVFYTLSKKLIKATDMNTLQEITKLDIEDN